MYRVYIENGADRCVNEPKFKQALMEAFYLADALESHTSNVVCLTDDDSFDMVILGINALHSMLETYPNDIALLQQATYRRQRMNGELL